MQGASDDSNIVLTDQITVVFRISDVNDEQPVFDELQFEVM